MDANNFDELVKTSTTFSSLDEASRQRILPSFCKVELSAKEILFYQGDPSECVYLLVTGKLSAGLVDISGESRTVGYIHPGETVGEMGALSSEPRSLTIKAVSDAVLLKLTTKDFIAICHDYPSVMFAILNPMVSRASSLIQVLSTEKRNKHIVIMPVNQDVSLEEFSEKLQEYADRYASTLIVSDYHPDFSDKTLKTNTVMETIKRYTKNKKSTHRTVYIISSLDTPLASVALKRANMIYVTAHAGTKPVINHHLLEIIESRRLSLVHAPSLILLHPDKSAIPRHTINWFKLTNFGLIHHIRMTSERDFHRLFRFIRGKAVGVVLGGGGTRGWAHIGVLKALQEAKIPIDIIGGSSVGALVAGMYAVNQSYKSVYAQFRQMVIESKNTISWRSLTWPIISLFNARKYTTAQIDLFKQQQIEDLLLPYFCITSNLANGTEDIHRSGTLWKKIRASTAIPGLIPPMVINGELHVDGGLLNNLPTDVMRQFIGSQGKIIAVELNDFTQDNTKYNFPPIQTFKDVLFRKLRIRNYHYKFPRLIDTFLRGLFLGSSLKNRQNSIIANIYINLNLASFRLLHSNQEEGDKLFKIGYEEAKKQIDRMKNKNVSPA